MIYWREIKISWNISSPSNHYYTIFTAFIVSVGKKMNAWSFRRGTFSFAGNYNHGSDSKD